MLKKLLLIPLFAILVSSCHSEISPEDEIREYVASIEKHFENRQAGKLKGYISEEYFDDYGYTKKDVIRFAAGYVLRRPTIHIRTKISELVIFENNNKAQFKVDVAVSKKPLDDYDIRLLQGEFHRFLIQLEKTKEWQLLSLRWQKVTVDDYLDDTK